MNNADMTALIMGMAFVLGFIMVVAGGLGFLKGQHVLFATKSKLAQGVVLAVAGLMFVAGMTVHFTGSTNTAFLRGQRQQTSACELSSETAHPDQRGGRMGVIGRDIVTCMSGAGFEWSPEESLCREAPVATNSNCYLPKGRFARAVTLAQLAFD
jgi:hypothetical protein